MRALLLAVLLLAVPAALAGDKHNHLPPINSGPGLDLIPKIHVGGQMSVGGFFGVDPAPTGLHDMSASGFHLNFVDIGIDGFYGDVFRVVARIDFNMDGVDAEETWIGVQNLPWDLRIRTGLFRSRAGILNERVAHARTFINQPLALGKFFGEEDHKNLGVDLRFDIPAPWTLRIAAAMTAAAGPGQRSWYGDQAIEVESLRDFVYQLGIENLWTVLSGRQAFGLDFHAVLGPNDSGRTNGTDVFAYTLSYYYRPPHPEESVGVFIETEWFLRRRQVIADVLQDAGGWAQLGLMIGDGWAVAGRYDFTQGVKDDPLDPADIDDRHRATLYAAWHAHQSVRLRLEGNADFGGPHGDDASYGVMLQLEAGYEYDPKEWK